MEGGASLTLVCARDGVAWRWEGEGDGGHNGYDVGDVDGFCGCLRGYEFGDCIMKVFGSEFRFGGWAWRRFQYVST